MLTHELENLYFEYLKCPKCKTFIKIAPENPVLWTGMKGVFAKSRKNLNQMLKQVQHDNRVRISFFCHPELVSGSRFLVLRIWVLKPRPVDGDLYYLYENSE
jgi:hypothetical protein